MERALLVACTAQGAVAVSATPRTVALAGRGKTGVALDFGWRCGSPLRKVHCFEFGFSRWGKLPASRRLFPQTVSAPVAASGILTDIFCSLSEPLPPALLLHRPLVLRRLFCHLLGGWQLRNIPTPAQRFHQLYGTGHLLHLQVEERLLRRQQRRLCS